ncbi:MAG TPA: membrane protein insertion efficiency factor YidD [Actinomycetota bacterium]|nr:membrane protein insertion efficiency factor YidD [Actinomycetota bacterium]
MSHAALFLRRALWVAGWPARVTLLALIGTYRALISPFLGSRCRFHPSCSAYAEEAVRVHGAVKGSALAAWRVLRCSPLTAGGLDPVPARGGSARRGTPQYDDVIQKAGSS